MIESLFWIIIILAILYVSTQLKWNDAYQILQYILMVIASASVYFYLSSRALYRESQQKTKKLIASHKELKNRQKTIDLIYKHSADGILILDQEQRIVTFSLGMEKITGFSQEEAIGRKANSFLTFRSEKNVSLLPDLMFSTASNRSGPYVRNSITNKDGRIVDIEASHTLIKDIKNNFIGLAVLRDVSYEEAIKERDKEFIAVTSHQLNTPLSIIRGYSSLLLSGKAGNLNNKQKGFVSEIKNSIIKMITLTNSLLSISRVEEDKIKLEISDVNIRDLFGNLDQTLADTIKEAKIKFNISPIDKNLIIEADEEKLIQALFNILDNAVKYTKKGSVCVEVIGALNKITITITDTGIGIDKEEQDKIGQKFYRSQNAIDIDNKGTGLGVFIAKTIISKHNGTLDIKSAPSKGTQVTIVLPKKQSSILRKKP